MYQTLQKKNCIIAHFSIFFFLVKAMFRGAAKFNQNLIKHTLPDINADTVNPDSRWNIKNVKNFDFFLETSAVTAGGEMAFNQNWCRHDTWHRQLDKESYTIKKAFLFCCNAGHFFDKENIAKDVGPCTKCPKGFANTKKDMYCSKDSSNEQCPQYFNEAEVNGQKNVVVLDSLPTTCKRCERNMYSPIVGLPECSPCPDDQYVPVGKTNDKGIACTSGDDCLDQLRCFKCGAGKIMKNRGNSDSDTKTTCDDCEAGKYMDETGKTLCKECPIGYSQSKTGIPFCVSCLPGRYQNVAGKNKCEDCVAGKKF